LLSTIQICGTPVKFDTKASFCPSGEKLGEAQDPILAIRLTDLSRSLGGAASVASNEMRVEIARREAMKK
jgi:hypothetical protein